MLRSQLIADAHASNKEDGVISVKDLMYIMNL